MLENGMGGEKEVIFVHYLNIISEYYWFPLPQFEGLDLD